MLFWGLFYTIIQKNDNLESTVCQENFFDKLIFIPFHVFSYLCSKFDKRFHNKLWSQLSFFSQLFQTQPTASLP